MEKIQHYILASLFIFWTAWFTGCINEPVKNSEVLERLVHKDSIDQYKHILIISKYQCKVYVDKKISELNREENESIRRNTLIIMDTTIDTYAWVRGQYSVLHQGENSIARVFPEIGNIWIFKNVSTSDTWLQKRINVDDTTFISFLKD